MIVLILIEGGIIPSFWESVIGVGLLGYVMIYLIEYFIKSVLDKRLYTNQKIERGLIILTLGVLDGLGLDYLIARALI